MSTAREMLKVARELKASYNHQVTQHIKLQDNSIHIFCSDPERDYIPSVTADQFHNDNTFIRLVMGPYGSGKSTMCWQEIVKRTCAMPYWYNGRRRAKWAIVRNTSGELYSTTLQTWLTWYGDLGDIRKREKPLLTYDHYFNDGNGIVELQLIFIALDREDDVRKVKSLEVTGCYLNELSEIPEAALSHFKGRVNKRYPSQAFCQDDYWSGIIADTNPPDDDHWIKNYFENPELDSYKIFKQPPGLLKLDDGKYTQNPDADNGKNLASDYYLKLAEGQKQGFINVYCLGKYGLVESGKRVYPEYNDDIHSSDEIKPIQGEPLYLGWDFGLTPACIVCQLTSRGQLVILKEYVSEQMGIRTFAQSVVLPALTRDFPYCKIGKSVADPSGHTADTIFEELSCIGELNGMGIKTDPATTNDIEPRLNSVRYFLNTMIDGKPAFVVSRKGCPILRKGFMDGYHYKRMQVTGEDKYQEKPNKNKYSHIHDSLQYVSLEFAADSIASKQAPREKIDMFNPVMRTF